MSTVWVGRDGCKVTAVFTSDNLAERSFRLTYSRRRGTITRVDSAVRFEMEMAFKDDVTGQVERMTFSGHYVNDTVEHL
jgi:hypothetical protein